MRIGILGAGFIGPIHAQAVSMVDGIENNAICCKPYQLEKTQEVADKFNIKHVYTDYDEMLSNPDIDAVYVAIPNSGHYSASLKAIRAGKCVICEKPFTTTLKEAKHLFDEAKKHGVMIWEAITTIYLPNFIDMKNNLSKLGDIKLVYSNYSQYSSRYDKFKEGVVMNAFNPAKAGGALGDINIYNIHFVVGLFGAPDNVHYYANIERGIDTSGLVVLEYPTFKAVCVGAKDCGAPSGANVQGDKGYFNITCPASVCTSYTMKLNNEDEVSINKNNSDNRMIDELVAFKHMFQTKDYEMYDRVTKHTLSVVDVTEKARASANLVFELDEE